MTQLLTIFYNVRIMIFKQLQEHHFFCSPKGPRISRRAGRPGYWAFETNPISEWSQLYLEQDLWFFLLKFHFNTVFSFFCGSYVFFKDRPAVVQLVSCWNKYDGTVRCLHSRVHTHLFYNVFTILFYSKVDIPLIIVHSFIFLVYNEGIMRSPII